MGRVGTKIKMKRVRRSLKENIDIKGKLPPLYKYLGVEGARLTLGNRTFKFAKPSDFNDLEDLTVRSVFDGELEAELSDLTLVMPDIIINNLDTPVTYPSPLKEQVIQIQSILKRDPSLLAEIKRLQPIEREIEASTRFAREFIDGLNESMQDYRVLCVTTELNSEYMWNRYAETHKGIALRIEPNIEKDSKFQLFKQVTYQQRRPALYKNAQMFIENALFGDKLVSTHEKIAEIIYTKTLDWRWEYEYRLAVPLLGEKPWNTLPYHPEEITELHLGAEVEVEFKKFVIDLARSINPQIEIFQVRRNSKGKLRSEAI